MRSWTGKKLKAVREQQGLSRKTLGQRVGAISDDIFIQRLEDGAPPTFEQLFQLADALEVPVAHIYEGKAFG